MKIYTIVVNNLKMWMRGDKPGPTNVKEDNSNKIIIWAEQSLTDLTHSSSFTSDSLCIHIG